MIQEGLFMVQKINLFITTDINIFNVQLKIASCLLNIKNFVEINKIEPNVFHSYWMNNDFNYSFSDTLKDDASYIIDSQIKVAERINNLQKMESLQHQFIGLQITINNNEMNEKKSNNSETMDIESNTDNSYEDYELEEVLEHRGLLIEDSHYLVKWKGYPDTFNQWLHYSRFNETNLITEYWNKQ